MQVVVAFPVDQKRVRTGLNELVEKEVRISDHHVYFKLQLCNPPQRLDHRCTQRNVGHKVSIHNVDVNSISAGTFRFSDLLTQTGKVSREDGGSKLNDALVHTSGPSW